MSNLIELNGSTPVAGTKIIADGFGRRHNEIIKIVKKYQSDFEKISALKADIIKGKTKSFSQYLLTEDQTIFHHKESCHGSCISTSVIGLD